MHSPDSSPIPPVPIPPPACTPPPSSSSSPEKKSPPSAPRTPPSASPPFIWMNLPDLTTTTAYPHSASPDVANLSAHFTVCARHVAPAALVALTVLLRRCSFRPNSLHNSATPAQIAPPTNVPHKRFPVGGRLSDPGNRRKSKRD